MRQRAIGIIGFGNMGSAIGQRLKSDYEIWTFDKDKNKTKNLEDIEISKNTPDLLNKVETVILAVKPQDFDTLLMQIKQYINRKLIISIAAGISTGYIESRLGKIHVIRVMPNLPAKVGKGMSCLCKGRFATDNDLDFAKIIFDYMGKTLTIKEEMMNAATAISGSGPGYFYHLIQGKQKEEWEDYGRNSFVPSLSASAQKIGFTPEQAQVLASATAAGSVALLKETGLSPKTLCIQVTSKGGTTEAGLKVLHSIDDLEATATAALRRAEELSKE